MSEAFFEREFNVYLPKNKKPVVFAHKKDLTHPKRYPLHLNDHIELYVYVSGDVDYIVGEDCIPLEKGDVVVILPHEVHVPVFRASCVYERFYMLIPTDWFSDFGFDALAQYRTLQDHRISLLKNKKEAFLDLLYQISERAKREDTVAERMRVAGLFLQAQGILNETGDAEHFQESEVRASGLPQNLLDILNHINLHASEIPSVDAIAKRFYLSPQYLSTMFKKHMGVNINHYLRIKKIAIAKGLLERGSSVTETCYECGFSDSSHFIKSFKQYVGMTPKQYQNLGVSRKS